MEEAVPENHRHPGVRKGMRDVATLVGRSASTSRSAIFVPRRNSSVRIASSSTA
jgi:hypothetical protein